MSRLGITFVLFFVCLVGRQHFGAHGILHDVAEVIDISNVDLANFQYFKGFPPPGTQSNGFLEHFQRKKAVLDYFDHLFLGLSPFTQASEIEFNPHYGRSWRPHFEAKYGKRGQRLVDALGRGLSLQQLKRYGAIPKDFGNRHYPT